MLILVGAWRLLRESTDILLESVPGHVSMVEVQNRMLGVEGVTGVHDVHVWAVTSELVAMSGHAIVPDLRQHPEVLERVRDEMSQLGIGHVTIQLEVQHECEEPRPVTTASGVHHGHPGHVH
jgi:cobalt-zinc-cadmium efflux system protein